MEKISAGLILYRIRNGKPEILLGHTGGPFYAKKDLAAWSFPKGIVEKGEDMLEAAKREFKEETGFDVLTENYIELGPVKRPGKTVYVWAVEGDCDPTKLKSNTCMTEWPPKSGKQIEIPEVDRGEFFDLETARTKLYGYLVPIIDIFKEKVQLK